MLINNIVDIHAHILPGVDDGAQTVTQSLQILEDLKRQGVGCVYATPHFYREKQNFDEYMKKTNAAWEKLLRVAKGRNLPELRRGCEVRAFRGMSTSGYLKELSLQNSHYVLIEIPYGYPIDNWLINELYNVQFTLGLKPIIAHIERYFSYRGFDRLMELVLEEDVRTQITSSAPFSNYAVRKKICNLIKNGQIHFIASDAHSLDTRRGMFLKANEKLAKKCGSETLLKLYERSRKMVHYDGGGKA